MRGQNIFLFFVPKVLQQGHTEKKGTLPTYTLRHNSLTPVSYIMVNTIPSIHRFSFCSLTNPPFIIFRSNSKIGDDKNNYFIVTKKLILLKL